MELRKRQSSPSTDFTETTALNDDILVKAVRGRISCEGFSDDGASQEHFNNIAISADQRMFYIATNRGVEIIQNDAASEKLEKVQFNTTQSVSIVKTTSDSNTFAMVLEDEPNNVVLTELSKKKKHVNIEFESSVSEIYCTDDLLIIVLAAKTYVFQLDSLKCIDQIKT